MEWVVGFVIFLGALVAISLIRGQRDHRTATTIEKRIRSLDDFELTDVYVSTFNLAGVAIDVGSSRAAVGRRELATAIYSVINCLVRDS